MNTLDAERIAKQLQFPADFFDPPANRPDDWQDDLNLRRAVDWFKNFIPRREWTQRRDQAARRLYLSALGINAGDGRFFDVTDSFGWYLFLAEAYLDHIQNYDYVFGSRVIPVFQAIGRDLHLLEQVDGIIPRVQLIVDEKRQQPNGGIFELLVASYYRRAGARVAFVEELPGQARTHDMDVTLNGQTWAVECKRMEVGEYSERERKEITRLWFHSSELLAKIERNTLCNVSFHVELQTIPSDYLTIKVLDWLNSGKKELVWEDATAVGHIAALDLRPLQRVLSANLVLGSSPRILELLTGHYVRNANYRTLLRTTPGDNLRYVDSCDLAVVLHWESVSENSLSSKARDIRKKLSEAVTQLPNGRPSIVHVGFEAVEGDKVESLRHTKILSTAKQFDPGDKLLEYVYSHYFVPESPPDGTWAFDETTQCCPIRPTRPVPIDKCFLVLPSGASDRPGPHWQEPK